MQEQSGVRTGRAHRHEQSNRDDDAVMNTQKSNNLIQTNDKKLTIYSCAVCKDDATGNHYGAFTCEGCKSFFHRTCKRDGKRSSTGCRLSSSSNGGIIDQHHHAEPNRSLGECKSGGKCLIAGSSRTACQLCRWRRCLQAGMSRHNSRYGRRSQFSKVYDRECMRMLDDGKLYTSNKVLIETNEQLVEIDTPPPPPVHRPKPQKQQQLPCLSPSDTCWMLPWLPTIWSNLTHLIPPAPSSIKNAEPQTEPLDLSTK